MLAPEPSSCHLNAGHRRANQQAPARLIPEGVTAPGFDGTLWCYDASSVLYSHSSSRFTPAASWTTFPYRSPPRLIHRSSTRWFETFSCTTISEDQQASIASTAPLPRPTGFYLKQP